MHEHHTYTHTHTTSNTVVDLADYATLVDTVYAPSDLSPWLIRLHDPAVPASAAFDATWDRTVADVTAWTVQASKQNSDHAFLPPLRFGQITRPGSAAAGATRVGQRKSAAATAAFDLALESRNITEHPAVLFFDFEKRSHGHVAITTDTVVVAGVANMGHVGKIEGIVRKAYLPEVREWGGGEGGGGRGWERVGGWVHVRKG